MFCFPKADADVRIVMPISFSLLRSNIPSWFFIGRYPGTLLPLLSLPLGKHVQPQERALWYGGSLEPIVSTTTLSFLLLDDEPPCHILRAFQPVC